jgi:coenzyme F420-reducing hydrogenase delta subunit
MKITLFYCANSLDQAAPLEMACHEQNVELKTISLPCSGKVSLLYLLKAIETGSDGVIVMTCDMGECRYLEGNLRARRRVRAVDDLMAETGFGRGRIIMTQPGKNHEVKDIIEEIINFARKTSVHATQETVK